MKQAVNKNEAVLSEAILEIAKRELREDKCTREQSLEQFRNWLTKNEDILNMRMDDNFLLRFLRAKKFSVPMAEQTLLKYLNIKRTFPEYSTQLDIYDEQNSSVLNKGYIFAVPKRDKNGRRVVVINTKGFDPKKCSSIDQAKAHFLTYEYLMEDPQTQVLGLTHICDCSGVTTANVTIWNPMEFARLFKWGEQSLPLRHKEIHLVNVPSGLKFMIDLFKNRMSQKMGNRITVHTNFKDLTKAVDPTCLPLEFGGEMPISDMVELWKQEIKEKRDVILKLDEITLLSDRGIQIKSAYTRDNSIKQSTFASHIESIQGSFRKLEFD